jgi:hypothetical protein
LEKPVLGHIDCPACGAEKGMRFIHDKNGKPFGHCDDCNAQLRVGGNSYREKKFAALYAWAAPKPTENPVTVTGPKALENPTPAAPDVPLPVSVPEQKNDIKVKKRSSLDDAVAFLSGARK